MIDYDRYIDYSRDDNGTDFSSYSVDAEIKARKKIIISAQDIDDAEDQVMSMFEDDEIDFCSDDITEISLETNEIRYPFQNLYDKDLYPYDDED